MTGYIRLEGVNIYDHLGDTNQLSVIRGGSLFLKDAIEHIADTFKTSLAAISTGASLGLFEVIPHPAKRHSLSALCTDIQTVLTQHDQYQYLTFTLVSLESDADFLEVEAELTALSRFQQVQQFNLVSPASSADAQGNNQACAVQGVRPTNKKVTEKAWLPEKWTEKYVSESVLSRAKAGVMNRKASLPNLTLLSSSLGQDITLTRNLEVLAKNAEKGNLNDKLALVYFDGNHFGKLRDQAIAAAQTPQQGYKYFDQTIINLREALRTGWVEHVTHILTKANSANKQALYDTYIAKEALSTGTEHQLRFESLLWGGDELLFVLPAWLGFEFLQFFNAHTRDWKDTLNVNTLTHAGGVVFCKAKTPIFRVRDLASGLADKIKAIPNGRQHNLYDLMLLESVDFPAEDLTVFQARTYGELMMACRPPLHADVSAHLTPLAYRLNTLSKSQVYQVCQFIQTDYAELAKSYKAQEITALLLADSNRLLLPRLQVGLTRFAAVMDDGDFPQLCEQLRLVFGEAALTTGWCWIWLREYWDYIEPLALLPDDAGPQNTDNNHTSKGAN